jgi:hypothetical protein
MIGYVIGFSTLCRPRRECHQRGLQILLEPEQDMGVGRVGKEGESVSFALFNRLFPRSLLRHPPRSRRTLQNAHVGGG